MDRKVFPRWTPGSQGKRWSEIIENDLDEIELFFFPPYSPELNPDELA
jgi:transposase